MDDTTLRSVQRVFPKSGQIYGQTHNQQVFLGRVPGCEKNLIALFRPIEVQRPCMLWKVYNVRQMSRKTLINTVCYIGPAPVF